MEYSGQLQALATLPLGENPHTHLVCSWVDPRADPDILEERISFATFSRNGTKDSPFCSRVTGNRDMKGCEFKKSLWK